MKTQVTPERSGSVFLKVAGVGALLLVPALGGIGCSGEFAAADGGAGVTGDDQGDAGGGPDAPGVVSPPDTDGSFPTDARRDANVEASDDATTSQNGDDASDDAGPDQPDVTVAPDATPPPPVDAGVDASPCNTTVDETAGVFVSPGGAGAACGSRTVPCSSVQTAIALAKTTGKTIVYLDQGTYNESIALAAGITLQGGWNDVGGTWKIQCTGDPAASAIIAAPTSANITVSATDFASGAPAATLDTLTIRSKASAAPSESLIGIVAGPNANLVLTRVAITVAAGGKGADGSTGPSASGATACGGTSAGDGQVGAGGGAGGAGSPGVYAVTGVTTGYAGAGNGGSPGSNGTAAAPGATATCAQCGVETSCCEPADGCTKPVCTSSCSTEPSVTVTGTAGKSGCGGNPGTGGTGGQGGGSSVGILAWGGSVTTSGGTIATGSGGGGGSGGAGGSGASGTAGAAGTGSCQDATCANNATKCSIGAVHNLGTAGTQGGAGGAGGQGGGGAGGDSFAYYQGNGGAVSVTGTNLAAGTAGAGGLPNGPAGQAAAHN